jgi:hypothetical protein
MVSDGFIVTVLHGCCMGWLCVHYQSCAALLFGNDFNATILVRMQFVEQQAVFYYFFFYRLLFHFSARLYIAYCVFWALGSLLAMQITFVGFNVVRSSEVSADRTTHLNVNSVLFPYIIVVCVAFGFHRHVWFLSIVCLSTLHTLTSVQEFVQDIATNPLHGGDGSRSCRFVLCKSDWSHHTMDGKILQARKKERD